MAALKKTSSQVHTEAEIKITKNMLQYYSELLVDPEVKQIPLDDWLSSYNGAKDGHLKFILKKCIPYVESLDFETFMEELDTDCIYERCDLLLQFLSHQESAKEEIFAWLYEQITPTNLAQIDCPNHCICSLLKLGIELIGKGLFWTTHLSVRLLGSIRSPRCALNCYMDLILASIEANMEDYDYTYQVYVGLTFKLDPAKFFSMESTINDKPEIMFNGISDILLVRKMVLAHLMIITRLNLSTVIVDTIAQQLTEMEEQVSKAIHWSYHPFVDLFLEDDSMLLKAVNCLVYLQGSIIRNELAGHQLFEKFIDSINHDTGVIIEWLSSDSEVADLTLKLLLGYLKLPNHETKCSRMVKIFFNQLLGKIDSLWKNKLFPYNPSALIKYEVKFDHIEDDDDDDDYN